MACRSRRHIIDCQSLNPDAALLDGCVQDVMLNQCIGNASLGLIKHHCTIVSTHHQKPEPEPDQKPKPETRNLKDD